MYRRMIRMCYYTQRLCDICEELFCIHQYLSYNYKEKREKVKNISAKHISILASITAQYELWNLQKHLNLFVASWRYVISFS